MLPPTGTAADVTFRIQAKGQVTVPKAARDELHLQPGDEVVWVRNEAGRWELWSAQALIDDVADAFEGIEGFVEQIRATAPRP